MVILVVTDNLNAETFKVLDNDTDDDDDDDGSGKKE